MPLSLRGLSLKRPGSARGSSSASAPTIQRPAAATLTPNCVAEAYEAHRLVHKASDNAKVGVTMNSADNGTTVVGELKPGSSAAQSGLIVGDEIISINGDAVDNAVFACTLLASAPKGYIEIVVRTVSPIAVGMPIIEQPAGPIKSQFDDEIELEPMKPMPAQPAYDDEFASMVAMGLDETACRHAIKACNGDVNAAVEKLIGGA